MAAHTLADVLLLITQTTGKLSEEVTASKKTGTKNTNSILTNSIKEKPDQEKTGTKNTNSLLANSIKQKPEQERVVKESIPVLIQDFSTKALNKLKFLVPTAKPLRKEEAVKEESGFMKFIKSLIGPALLILGGLAAFIMGILNDGPLKGLLTLLGKGGILGGIKWLKSMLLKKLSGIFKFIKDLIPTEAIGRIFVSLKNSLKSVASKVFSGMKFIGSKLKSIIPINFFSKIFGPIKEGFVKLTSGLLKPFIGISKGLGKGLFTKILSSAAKLITPLLKRIPGIGSLLDWYSAYTRFQKGDILGGLIDVASGIATMVPLYGTPISIGLSVLNAFLDYKAGGSDVAGGKAKPKSVMLGEFFKKIKNKLILGLWNMIPDFSIFGVSVKGRLASVMGLDIPGLEAEVAQSEAVEKLANEQKIEAEKLADQQKMEAEKKDNENPLADINTPTAVNPDDNPLADILNNNDTLKDVDNTVQTSNYENVSTDDDTQVRETIKLKEVVENSNKLLIQQVEILNESKKILAELMSKISNTQNNNNTMVSSKNTVTNIFQQSSIRDLQRAYI